MKTPAWILLLALGACASPPTQRCNTVVEERLLATIPDEVNVILPVVYSRDGQRAAFAARAGGVDRPVCGEWTGKTYAVV